MKYFFLLSVLGLCSCQKSVTESAPTSSSDNVQNPMTDYANNLVTSAEKAHEAATKANQAIHEMEKKAADVANQ